MNFRLTAAAAIVSALLAACAPMQNLRESDRAYADTSTDAGKLISQMRQPAGAGNARDTVKVTDDPWVDRRPIHATERRLPVAFNCTIVFKPLVPTSLLQFAQQVSQDCQVPVRVTPDAVKAVSGEADGTGAAGSSTGGGYPRLTGLPALPALPASAGGGSMVQPSYGSGSPEMLTDIDWRGPLAGLLDLVTARSGLSWRFNESTQSISIFYLDTRTYSLDAFPTRTNLTSTIQTGMTTTAGTSSGVSSGGSSGSSGTGGVSGTAGSAQTTSTTMESDLYKDVTEAIKALLTPSLGRMAINATTGTVTVIDTPEVLERIGGMLSHENAMLRQQIIFHTKILAVTLDANDEVGVKWDVVYKTLSGKYGVNFATPFQPASGAGTLGASIINSGEFAGSSAVLSALSQLGKVSTVTSPSGITLNLRPLPVQIASQISYVARAEISTTQGVGATSGLQPGSFTVGFNMNLTPRLMADGQQMVVQYAFNISALNQLRQVTSAGTTIELPDLDTRLFNGEVSLRSGQTLILHGFEQEERNGNRAGMVSPFAWMLGGNMKAKQKKTAIVILITPEVQSSQGAGNNAQASWERAGEATGAWLRRFPASADARRREGASI